MTRVLVTGGSGFIGRQALPLLVDRGHDVHVVGRGDAPLSLPTDVHWHAGDLLDARRTDELLDAVRPAQLLHFAWYATPPDYWTSPENMAWVEASLRLLRRFAALGGERAVMAGTCAEYDLAAGYCIEDVTALRPATVYGACKHALQTVTGAAADQLGISSAWGRIFFLYGPSEHPSRLVASVIGAILAGESACCSHGRQVRDFLHVADVAAAFVHLLESAVEGPVNIASGVPVTVGAVASRIGELMGRPELVMLGARDSPPDEPPIVQADVRRLQSEVGWRPARSLDVGLTETIDWWRRRASPSARSGADGVVEHGRDPGHLGLDGEPLDGSGPGCRAHPGA